MVKKFMFKARFPCKEVHPTSILYCCMFKWSLFWGPVWIIHQWTFVTYL